MPEHTHRQTADVWSLATETSTGGLYTTVLCMVAYKNMMTGERRVYENRFMKAHDFSRWDETKQKNIR